MIRTTTIDHVARREMGLSSIDWIVADYIRKAESVVLEEFKVTQYKISEDLGLATSQVAMSLEKLRRLEFLIEGEYATTMNWREWTEFGTEDITTGLNELWDEFIVFWNETALRIGFGKITGRNRSAKKAFKDAIRNCGEKVTITHLELMLLYLADEWDSEEMIKYIRPSTIFKTGTRLAKYMEESVQWRNTKQATKCI